MDKIANFIQSDGFTLGMNLFNTVTGSINDYLQNKMSTQASYYQAKLNGAYETTNVYNQTVPLYQRIGAQVREMMNAQANQYLNAGVDISQGTAFKVLQHTREQGDMKIEEIRKNMETQVSNIQSMSSMQASMAMMSGSMNLANSIGNRINSFTNSTMKQVNLYKTKGDKDDAKITK